MPGRRNYAREAAAHAARAPELQRRYAALLRHADCALIGRIQILAYLHRLGIRRLNGDVLTWRIVNSWRRDHDAPILPGNRTATWRSPALSTVAHLAAWILSRLHSGALFTVAKGAGLHPHGHVPCIRETQGAQGSARRAS